MASANRLEPPAAYNEQQPYLAQSSLTGQPANLKKKYTLYQEGSPAPLTPENFQQLEREAIQLANE